MLEPRKNVRRRIFLAQQPSGVAELLVFCPLQRGQVELDHCVACEFFRGLAQRPRGCELCCRYPDFIFGLAAAAES